MEEEDAECFTPRAPGSTASAVKTPISLLQELCARHGLTPDYKLLSVEGVVHAPTFMYRVEVSNVVATATGQSKKKAKHSAAKAVLEKLLTSDGIFTNTSFEDGTTIDNTNFTSVITEPSSRSSPQDDGVPGNPVGALQELCMKRRWRPPYYETILVKGLPHERTFGITCNVNTHNHTGVGKSKRMAKRQAAHSMMKELEKIIEQGAEKDGTFDEDKVHGKEDSKDETKGDQQRQRSGPAIPNHGLMVSKFVEKMAHSTFLSQIDDVDPTEDDIDLLQKMGKEHDFVVLFFNLNKKGHSGKHYCLVQLGSVPVAVCYGSGLSPEEAKQMAAHNALQFFRILAQKS